MVTRRFLEDIEHRPWPMPPRRWTIFQSWRHLLFAHYRVDRAELEPLIPPPLELQEFDGTCWIGVVPFYLVIRPRFIPGIPGFSFFPEINVRTYVEYEGRSGVWFFSLDASNSFAVWSARKFFSLPYFRANIRFRKADHQVSFRSRRRKSDIVFDGTYAPTGEPSCALPGTLEHFLAERYRLYTVDSHDRLIHLDVHHSPWPLQPAEAQITTNSMCQAIGIDVGQQQPLLHYAERIDVACWPKHRRGSLATLLAKENAHRRAIEA